MHPRRRVHRVTHTHTHTHTYTHPHIHTHTGGPCNAKILEHFGFPVMILHQNKYEL